jgi:catechol 2,3-dioxygenase-like lactoylglutathione lyase family enzyme
MATKRSKKTQRTTKAAAKRTAKPATKRSAKPATKRRATHDHRAHPASRHAPSARPQPLIAVRDVEASTGWYAQLLGAERLGGDTHGNLYDRVMSENQLILQLHAWDRENHPNLVGEKSAPLGHGVLLWFELDDFDAAVERARAMKASVVEEPHVNPGPHHREMWLRDPDGYVVIICSPDGEAG